MTYNVRQSATYSRVRKALLAIVALGCAFSAVGNASAQSVMPPPTPIDITPPAGNTAFLVGHAVGSQGYTCLPTSDGGTSWNPSARPEATLFTDVLGTRFQIITHFASINERPIRGVIPPLSGNATWQSSLDTSRVWAVKTGQIDAGNDPVSCPHTGSIQCLLLQSVGNEAGPTGGKLLANVTFVQRLNTNGGSAPATACSAGQTQLQHYTADYYFYRKSQ